MTHRENTNWLRRMENELGELKVQDNIHIEIKIARKQVRKMPNWNSPGLDSVQGYWIKNLSNLHNSKSLKLNKCLQENNLLKSVVTGKTLLCIKEIQKRNLVSNFRPITCLPLIWKLLAGILAEELHERSKKQIHYHGNKSDGGKKAEAQKINYSSTEMIVKDCKRRLTSLAVVWIDYRKAYNMVPIVGYRSACRCLE